MMEKENKNNSSNKFEKKGEFDKFTLAMIILVIVIILGFVLYEILIGKGNGAWAKIQNLFRFG